MIAHRKSREINQQTFMSLLASDSECERVPRIHLTKHQFYGCQGEGGIRVGSADYDLCM